LRIVDDRVVRKKMLGPKADDKTGDWTEFDTEGASCFVLFTENYPGDQIKKNEVGGSRDTYGGEERCIQNFGAET